MGKGLGIAALVIVATSLFIPMLGILTTWVGLVIAAIAASIVSKAVRGSRGMRERLSARS